MKEILAKQIPIIGAIRLPFKAHTSKDGILVENAKLDFNFGVMFVGYTDKMHGSSDGYFIFQNSWGKRWGDKGYGYISYNAMMKQKCFDLWIITKVECENKDLDEHKLMEIDVALKVNIPTFTTANINLIDKDSSSDGSLDDFLEDESLNKNICTCVAKCDFNCTATRNTIF